MSAYAAPSEYETELLGSWINTEGQLTADDAWRRIDYLVTHALIRLASDASGWFTLYRDTSDGRYWELSYPHSDEAGGGPPRLAILSGDKITSRYSMI